MPASAFDDLRVEAIKRELAEYVSQGTLDSALTRLLVSDAGCAPVECELLDYKERLEDDKRSRAKAVLQIVSFYNTYGGYLVYGVKERERDTLFEAIGLERGVIDIESLKAQVKDYTGERIGISLQYLALPRNGEDGLPERYVAAIHVPKRKSKEPLAFGKDGPGDDRNQNRPIFLADDVYYRRSDECAIAKGKTVLFLAGPRDCPYQRAVETIDELVPKKENLEHNLPDRAVICPRFIGRSDEIDQLWAWFADDLSHVRVLAGEGGLGKTSIAFQFAEEVSVSQESSLERIIWLTAKQQQFLGMRNEHVDMPETHFTSYQQLLHVLCGELGFLAVDFEGASEKRLKKMIQEGAEIIPSLIVVDDVDSLSADEQRKTLEVGFLFGGGKSRLLMTTRINQSYSEEIAIQIRGFGLEDYEQYVSTLRGRYGHIQITKGQTGDMHYATSGSPLYTESLYRLMRWMPFSEAMREWRGKKGEEVRAAALQREINDLTPEAKRVLLANALLQECSMSELGEVTGYADSVLRIKVDELQSIYLLSAPKVTEEIRVRVGVNTREYVLLWAPHLVADHAWLEKRAKELRSSAKQLRVRRDNPLVGAAINQSLAQLKRGDPESALETVVAAQRSVKNSPDLIVMQARCLLKLAPPKFDEARRLAKKAYEEGARKEVLFFVWYEAEWGASHYTGAAEVAGHAIKNVDSSKQEWFLRRAAATWYVAKDQERNGNIDRALADYWMCDSDLREAQTLAGPQEQYEIRSQRAIAHNAIWDLLSKADRTTFDVPARAFDEVLKMLECGDVRMPVCLHLCEALRWLNTLLSKDATPIAEGLRNLVEQRLRQAKEAIQRIGLQRRGEQEFEYVLNQLREAEGSYARVVRRRGFASS